MTAGAAAELHAVKVSALRAAALDEAARGRRAVAEQAAVHSAATEEQKRAWQTERLAAQAAAQAAAAEVVDAREAAAVEVDECYRKLVVMTRAYEEARAEGVLALREVSAVQEEAGVARRGLQDQLDHQAAELRTWRARAEASEAKAAATSGELAKFGQVSALIASLAKTTIDPKTTTTGTMVAGQQMQSFSVPSGPLKPVEPSELSQQLNQLTPVREAKAHLRGESIGFIPPGVSPHRGGAVSQSSGTFSFNSEESVSKCGGMATLSPSYVDTSQQLYRDDDDPLERSQEL